MSKTINRHWVSVLVSRALSARGWRTKYKLGAGGFGEFEPHVGGDSCDCTGFISWIWQTRRSAKPGRPWEIQSDSMVKAVRKNLPGIVKLDGPQIGCVAVYPGKWIAGVRIKAGHAVFIWSGDEAGWGMIDCKPSNFKKQGDAIASTHNADCDWMLKRKDVVFVCLEQHLENPEWVNE